MEGEVAQLALMGKYIGAGLATIGLGGAGIGVGHIAGNFLAGGIAQPISRTCTNGKLLRRRCLCRSFGDLLVPDRFAVDVRSLISDLMFRPDGAALPAKSK